MSSPHVRTSGFSLHVTITIDPANISAFLAAFRPVYKAVVAEPDCTYFEVFHSLEEPGVFRFVENWSKDPQWFKENQLTKAYYIPYVEATEPMWIKPRSLKFFERFSEEWVTLKPGNY
ncbi:hypothetical protein TrVFT333_004625 [Trichoderma virens FT-333]|nr:hypothetical protein TrVFT333_004625 [Trichoderma virens FT-333]